MLKIRPFITPKISNTAYKKAVNTGGLCKRTGISQLTTPNAGLGAQEKECGIFSFITEKISNIFKSYQKQLSQPERYLIYEKDSEEVRKLLNTVDDKGVCTFYGKTYLAEKTNGDLRYRCITSDASDCIYRREIETFSKIQESFNEKPTQEYIEELLEFLPQKSNCLCQKNLLAYLRSKGLISLRGKAKTPPPPTFQEFHTKLKNVVKKIHPDKSGEEQEKIQAQIAKYLNEQLNILTPKECEESCDKLYKAVNEYAAQQGIDAQNIYYAVPLGCNGGIKSYDVVAAMYAKKNNIPLDKFVRIGKENVHWPKNSLVVILDDMLISGSSMRTAIRNVLRKNQNFNVSTQSFDFKLFIGALSSTENGLQSITQALERLERRGDCLGKVYNAQEKVLKPVRDNETRNAIRIMNPDLWKSNCPDILVSTSMGYDYCANGIGTWYMGADNNSAVASAFLERWLPRKSLKMRFNG